jgi:hypothetical protein
MRKNNPIAILVLILLFLSVLSCGIFTTEVDETEIVVEPTQAAATETPAPEPLPTSEPPPAPDPTITTTTANLPDGGICIPPGTDPTAKYDLPVSYATSKD